MRALTTFLSASLFSVLASTAMAETTGGTINHFDRGAQTITMNSGKLFSLPSWDMVYGFSAGDQVVVTWASDGASSIVSKLVKVPQSNSGES